jgi:hypothetical protein
MTNSIFIGLSAVLIMITFVAILRFLNFYNSYQRHLKEKHPDEYKRLVFKDKIVEMVGEWFRWPIGSAGPILAIFNTREYCGDKDLFKYQRKALIWLSIFLVALILTLAIFIKYNAT